MLARAARLNAKTFGGHQTQITAEGKAIGIEITAPSKVSLDTLNAVLQELGPAPASQADLAPVLAA